jgi:hypothetical protein
MTAVLQLRDTIFQKAFKRLATVLHSNEEDALRFFRRALESKLWKMAASLPQSVWPLARFTIGARLFCTQIADSNQVARPDEGMEPGPRKSQGISVRFGAAGACAHTRTGLDIDCGLTLLGCHNQDRLFRRGETWGRWRASRSST